MKKEFDNIEIAVHIEVVFDLTMVFLAAFDRFIGKGGLLTDVRIEKCEG